MKKITFISALLLLLLCTGCTKDVTDQDLSVTFQDKAITGQYTGQLVDDVATSDNATFTYKNGNDYLNYTGPFKDGKFSGNGTLESNMYVAHFSDVDRHGEYKGDVVDGIPKGNGTFKATNDQGKTYTYEGEWDNGLFDGHGKKTFEDNDAYEGTYVKGEFAPTKLEFLKVAGRDIPNTDTDIPFIMSNDTVNFINSDDIFPTDNFENIKNLVDTSIEFKHLQKNIEDYSGKLISTKGYISSIREENLGQNISIICLSSLDGGVYHIYYFGKLDDIFNGDSVSVYGLPLGNTSYRNVGNTITKAVVLLGSYITKSN